MSNNKRNIEEKAAEYGFTVLSCFWSFNDNADHKKGGFWSVEMTSVYGGEWSIVGNNFGHVVRQIERAGE